MPSFQYKALQADGTLAEGQIEAGGRQEAFRQMAERGLRPVSLAEKAAKAGKTDAAVPAFNFKSNKVSSRDLENFTRLLSNLLSAGVPLSRALVILCKEASSPAAAAQWKQIHAAVIDGVSLADAMAKSPDTFPRVYTAMVEAGETGGFLDLVLSQIADFQAREKDMRAKVISAMIYPVVLLVLIVCVLIFLMVYFIPKFQMMFSQLPGAQLPMITQVIIGISHAMIHYGLWMLLGLVVAGIMAKTWVTSEKGKRIWEALVLRVPVLGPLIAQFAMARFCRMLGTLLGAGVPLVQSLNVARKSLGNQILVDAVTNSIETVKEGGQLGKSLAECRNLFSSSVLEMISVAEESGKLDAELVRIAAVTEADLDRNLKTATSLLEPIMLFVMAAVVGTIFIGMVLPIYSLQDQIK
jgi:type II secretory pathway component PulF